MAVNGLYLNPDPTTGPPTGTVQPDGMSLGQTLTAAWWQPKAAQMELTTEPIDLRIEIASD